MTLIVTMHIHTINMCGPVQQGILKIEICFDPFVDIYKRSQKNQHGNI